LTNTLLHYLDKIPDAKVVTGLNVSAESFYSTQGRTDSNFVDNNEHLLDHICSDNPTAVSMEMETFQLLHLAKCAKDVNEGGAGKIHATAAAVILFNRHTNEVIQEDICHLAEKNAGLCALKALVHQSL
jgi:uridine phosphorylase